MNEVTAVILERGLLGAITIALAIVVWKLYRAYNCTQDTRVDEAKAVTDKVLALSEEWLQALSELTAMVRKHADNVTQLRDECRERTEGVAMMIREMIRDLRTYTDDLRRRNRPGGD